jgi:hypothetical protein
MFNGIIDTWEVRAQMATQSSQSSGSSFIPRRSEEQHKIELLKETLRQQDKYYSQALVQQQTMLQVS